MKIAVTGKGGVGKTTFAALLAYAYTQAGCRVLAVDADPDANLASTLRFTNAELITPLSRLDDLIEERTGSRPGTYGALFKINPTVADLPEKLWVEEHGIRLMVMGGVKKGGGGCVCPESVFLKSFIQHLILYRDEVVIMDMEAGVEHLGRATAAAVQACIVVVEPGKRSLETARRIRSLAQEIGIKYVPVVGNRVRNEHEQQLIRGELTDFPVLGFLPYDENVIEADQKNLFLWQHCPQLLEEVKRILNTLDKQ
ncbi:MAG TPA: AAA family ATPase [Thermodesulfobacteriota bacterium]|nr:AAA family ATPase [Deltaproteobacteria bacterium]HNR13201.1 AAA family ATPase [Thermodesulfobacteriota bacterium]HNU71178.1 AAA family ATPase [Thermodesulfobacteriota bacterium]HOC38760.1 AAA family ATPase [Thermodesulfobacteriota bacterium]